MKRSCAVLFLSYATNSLNRINHGNTGTVPIFIGTIPFSGFFVCIIDR